MLVSAIENASKKLTSIIEAQRLAQVQKMKRDIGSTDTAAAGDGRLLQPAFEEAYSHDIGKGLLGEFRALLTSISGRLDAHA